MRSVSGQSDLVESPDGGSSQRTRSGEMSSLHRNDSPGVATDDQRPVMYIIPAIVAGLVLIIAGAVAVMYLWKRRQQRHNLGQISFCCSLRFKFLSFNLIVQFEQAVVYRYKVALSVCRSVCLSSGFLKNVQTDFHETLHGS